MKPKIVIVGGGSYAWGPLFVRDILLTPALRASTVVLHDINPDALELVYRVGQLVIAQLGSAVALVHTTDLEEALTGADFVILTITTGGLEAMRHDLEIPADFGVFQSVGDTVGPGGLARALRNIPVVVGLARAMERLCPEAWLLNYTNPLTTLTRAVTRETRIRTVGLCHEWPGVRHRLARAWGLSPGALHARVAGINHLPWLLDLHHAGGSLWSQLHRLTDALLAGEVDFDPDDDASTADKGRLKARLFKVYGALPVAGDRHVAEFFSGILGPATDYGGAYAIARTPVAEREAWCRTDRERLEAILRRDLPLAPFLQAPSGEAAAPIMAALSSDGAYEGILNLPNRGQIANLPRDVVVETAGVVRGDGAFGFAAGELPLAVHAVVSRHVANQELTVEAGLRGDRTVALQVLLNDPLTALGPLRAKALLDRLLAAHAAYLPQFSAQTATPGRPAPQFVPNGGE